MEVVVKYQDYENIIDEVELVINKDQKKVFRIIKPVNTSEDARLQMETIDETISFSVSQELDSSELRDYIQICQKILKQMLNNK